MAKRFTSVRDNEPLRVVVASKLVARMADFQEGLAAGAEVEIFQADSGEGVLQLLAGHTIDLVAIDGEVVDMAGLGLAKEVARLHPFVSSVLVSEKSEADFHEETEGLGVLMRLPDPPQEASALLVLHHLEKTFAARAVEE